MTTDKANMIKAFQMYYSDDRQETHSKESAAVQNCLFMFKRIKNGNEIQKAIEAVYIRNSGGNVSSRVRRFAIDTYVSEGTVYGYLRKATELYVNELKLLS